MSAFFSSLRRRAAVVLAFVVFASVVAVAKPRATDGSSYERALAAYQATEYSKAHELWLEALAETGPDAPDQAHLRDGELGPGGREQPGDASVLERHGVPRRIHAGDAALPLEPGARQGGGAGSERQCEGEGHKAGQAGSAESEGRVHPRDGMAGWPASSRPGQGWAASPPVWGRRRLATDGGVGLS